MKTYTNHTLGELEKKIMEIVWVNKQPITVRKVCDVISAQRSIAYTTIMTVMGRLVHKGLLTKQRRGKADVYKASYSKDKFLKYTSRQIINNLLSSFGDIAIAYFANELEKIPARQRKNLVKILKNSKK